METTEERVEKKLDRELIAIYKRLKVSRTGVSSFSSLFTDRMVLVAIIQNGIPYSFFEVVKAYAPFSDDDWAAFLDLSSKSLYRYRGTSRQFASLQSERILEIVEVTKLGLEVFGEAEKFRLWLNTPSFAFGRKRPKELLSGSYGKELVIGELTRINQGIFA